MTARTMSTAALYPGSFDPFHLGHLDVVEQAAELFGEVVVVAMHNPAKPSGLYPLAATTNGALRRPRRPSHPV